MQLAEQLDAWQQPVRQTTSARTSRQTAKPSGKRWSAADKRQIVRDYVGGMTFAELARKYNRTIGAIRLRLVGKKAGLMHDEAFVRSVMSDAS
jgi:transposase-like protein